MMTFYQGFPMKKEEQRLWKYKYCLMEYYITYLRPDLI